MLTAFIMRLIALMMEAASTSETSVNFYQTTRRNIPEDTHLHTLSRQNLKSHIKVSGHWKEYFEAGAGMRLSNS
jgi:hypothetical protein